MSDVFRLRKPLQRGPTRYGFKLSTRGTGCHIGLDKARRHRIDRNSERADLARSEWVKPIIEAFVAA